MVYRGRVHNGTVILEKPCPWSEGTELIIEPIEPRESGKSAGRRSAGKGRAGPRANVSRKETRKRKRKE